MYNDTYKEVCAEMIKDIITSRGEELWDADGIDEEVARSIAEEILEEVTHWVDSHREGL